MVRLASEVFQCQCWASWSVVLGALVDGRLEVHQVLILLFLWVNGGLVHERDAKDMDEARCVADPEPVWERRVT